MLGYQLADGCAREDSDLTPTTPRPDDDPQAKPAVWQSLIELAGTEGKRWPQQAAGLARATPNDFVDLYLPLCRPVTERARVLGHLGQSIDGYIAAASGDSSFVNDQENIRHLHRLRALHDAVIVGAGTVAADDPRLTTRRVPGPSPVRVVLDPNRRLSESFQVFRDGAARTVLVVAGDSDAADRHGDAEVLFVPATDGLFDLRALVVRLAGLGLRRLFVEGGGTTVTRFFEAGLLDRLQIAVAPMFIGRGRPGIRIAAQASIADCPRPRNRVFAMGQDILFDCDLSGEDAATAAPPSGIDEAPVAEASPIRRIR
ncbi:MAG TPA: RibD family protein [Gammaproteobacteria bacterium]